MIYEIEERVKMVLGVTSVRVRDPAIRPVLSYQHLFLFLLLFLPLLLFLFLFLLLLSLLPRATTASRLHVFLPTITLSTAAAFPQ